MKRKTVTMNYTIKIEMTTNLIFTSLLGNVVNSNLRKVLSLLELNLH